jgi:ABC-type phosphate transport system substrate-binding protein
MIMRFRTVVLALAGFVLAPALRAQDLSGVRVVAHESVDVSTLTRAELSQLFLKKRTAWRPGAPAKPVDQVDASPVRRLFSKAVHKKEPELIKSFWQQQIFSGRAVPPPEKAGDEEVLAYVRSTPGAVGYVSRAAAPAGVKTITVTE